jgi:hypothetical protein
MLNFLAIHKTIKSVHGTSDPFDILFKNTILQGTVNSSMQGRIKEKNNKYKNYVIL